MLSPRGILGIALALTYSPDGSWWQQAILIVSVSYILITALFGRRD
ncbi:hypothetical protein [Brevibacillus porteri]|nr:hypothetical protein [Brevibacillus porteri]MED1801756.1 hypothetical protein [Brevibacillus porteri]MED2134887.1 hypothetical protein [Brevibacillus porteri]MED2748394.1 hypothetical protein [Brevibacillus porteri]MED2897723.1 hypothetical protein [Brevibacillus porteri]